MVNTLGHITVNVPFDVLLTHPWYPEDKGMVIKNRNPNFKWENGGRTHP